MITAMRRGLPIPSVPCRKRALAGASTLVSHPQWCCPAGLADRPGSPSREPARLAQFWSRLPSRPSPRRPVWPARSELARPGRPARSSHGSAGARSQSYRREEKKRHEHDDPADFARQSARPATRARQLGDVVRRLAASPADWLTRVRLNPEGRWYERIHLDDSHEVWVISWLPGQATGFHDHGGSAGAFAVVWGTLVERRVVGARTTGRSWPSRSAGRSRAFGPRYIHDVRNGAASAVAVSVHAYSPPLPAMTRYDLTPGPGQARHRGRGGMVMTRPPGAPHRGDPRGRPASAWCA